MLGGADGIRELPAFRNFIVADVHALAKFDAGVRGDIDVEASTARPGTTVVDVTSKALLPQSRSIVATR